MSVGTKAEKYIRNVLHFAGLQPPPTIQYCDSTSAVQVARNPHSLGASRSLGIRMHGTRYAIAHQGLRLEYSITEDMVADCPTKRLARQKLARFALIFFNNLRPDWEDDYDHLRPMKDQHWYRTGTNIYESWRRI